MSFSVGQSTFYIPCCCWVTPKSGVLINIGISRFMSCMPCCVSTLYGCSSAMFGILSSSYSVYCRALVPLITCIACCSRSWDFFISRSSYAYHRSQSTSSNSTKLFLSRLFTAFMYSPGDCLKYFVTSPAFVSRLILLTHAVTACSTASYSASISFLIHCIFSWFCLASSIGSGLRSEKSSTALSLIFYAFPITLIN